VIVNAMDSCASNSSQGESHITFPFTMNRFNNTDRGLEPKPNATERGLTDQPRDRVAQASPEGRTDKDEKSIELIFLSGKDTKLVEAMTVYAQQVYRSAVTQVDSIAEIARTLVNYSRVGRLVLSVHGGRGAIRFGSEQRSRWVYLTSPDWKTQFQSRTPTIHTIEFETCSVGLDPLSLIAFGKLFRAAEVVAWNHFHVVQVAKLPAAKRGDKTKDAFMEKYRPYVVGGEERWKQVMSSPDPQTVLLEWFREDQSEAVVPEPSHPTRKDFIPRTKATDKTITNESDAQKYMSELNDPVLTRPLHRVIVESQ
jgi:hypothetical protein